MTSPTIEDFNQKFSRFSEFRQQIRQVDSLPQMLAVLKEWDCPLSGPELVSIANEAYQTWWESLDSHVQPFFAEVHENKAMHQSLEACRTPKDVVLLAQSIGFNLTEADIRSAAVSAHKIEGFSFEKLWFKSLGL